MVPLGRLAGAFSQESLAPFCEDLSGPVRAELMDETGRVVASFGRDAAPGSEWTTAETPIMVSRRAAGGIRLRSPFDPADVLLAAAQAMAAEMASWLRYLAAAPEPDNRDEIISIFSHELRTPIAVIKGLCEFLMSPDAVPPSELPEYLVTIHRNVDRLSSIVSNILVVSKLDQQITQLRPQPIPAQGTLDTDMYADMAKAKGLRLHLDVRDVLVYVDHFAAAQIFNNLVSNAVKYTPPGGQVAIRVYEEADGRVHFVVTDTGIGIPAEHIPYVFQKFYRVRGAEERKQPGSGLGMYIVKRYVELSGGDVWIESPDQQGTSVHVLLPGSYEVLHKAPLAGNER